MKWAMIGEERVAASPSKIGATCPFCKKGVVRKCGVIKIWHWAHKQIEDCDKWRDGETTWHLEWKGKFPNNSQEIIIKKCISDYCNDKKYAHNHHGEDHGNCVDCEEKIHIADIKIGNFIVEFQNSPISIEDIEKREKFYDNMCWVLNGNTIGKGITLIKNTNKNNYTFRWKHPRKSWWYSTKDLYISWGENSLFKLKTMHETIPCRGWGTLISKKEFISEVYVNGCR